MRPRTLIIPLKYTNDHKSTTTREREPELFLSTTMYGGDPDAVATMFMAITAFHVTNTSCFSSTTPRSSLSSTCCFKGANICCFSSACCSSSTCDLWSRNTRCYLRPFFLPCSKATAGNEIDFVHGRVHQGQTGSLWSEFGEYHLPTDFHSLKIKVQN